MSRKERSKIKTLRKPKKPATREQESESVNRELAWLHFNRRVLHEAEDARNPLLERIRFLGICQSNLDEFFMKRVGGLKKLMHLGVSAKDGLPQEQVAVIRQVVLKMVEDQARCFRDVLKPLLAQNGVHLVKWKNLTVAEKDAVKKFYMKTVYPVLTPLAVDPGHPFPFISNLSTSLGVTLRHPDREEKLFARVKVPQVLPQWIKVDTFDSNEYKFVSLLDVIEENLKELFPSMQILHVMPFRLTRNAEIERDEDGAEDLLEMIEEELKQRRFAEIVRLEHGPNPDPWILKFLIDELELLEQDIYEHPEALDYRDISMLVDLPLPKLKFEPWAPTVPPLFAEENANVFHLVRHSDFLLHHPFESFAWTIEKFIRQAAEDPKVLAIKMTLYRTGDQSPFVRALVRAAEAGKQVVCLVELKARFDEERNIYWAQALENAGVHVVYGIVGFKTHAKTALVVRQDNDGIRCYCHIATGNYNTSTSRSYTDLGLLTSKEPITSEIVELFHYLTGRSLKNDYQYLLVAPVNMLTRFTQMVDREREHAAAKRPAHIVAKFNNMEDSTMTQILTKASQDGVEIDLIIRGFCTLRPGVKGVSERIRVVSVIGRFLEHSRIFYFRNGKEDPLDGDFFIGSADWMYRNLHARVECIVPILDRPLREKCWEILQIMLKDQRQAWDMQPDGTYIQRRGTEPAIGTHQQLMLLTKGRVTHTEDAFHSGDFSDGNSTDRS